LRYWSRHATHCTRAHPCCSGPGKGLEGRRFLVLGVS
jgi:hypothetical protein